MRFSRLHLKRLLGLVGAMTIVSIAWVTSSVFQERTFTIRKYQFRHVCLLMETGSGGGQIPAGLHFNRHHEPTVGWRTELVAEYLPTGTHFQPETKWNDPTYDAIQLRGRNFVTRYGESGPLMMAIVGPGTAFNVDGGTSILDIPPDTILFVEVVRPDVNWMQPIDIEISSLTNSIHDRIPNWIRSDLRGGFHVAFADGQVWFISRDVPASLLARFANISKTSSRNRDVEISQYRIR